MLSEILFTKPVHKDTRSEHQFAEELTKLKIINYQSTPSFEIDFPKPKNSKQRYYFRLLKNAMITRFNKMTENYQGAHFDFERKHHAEVELSSLKTHVSYLKEYFDDHRISVYERSNPKANSDLSYIITCYRANLAVLFKEFLNLTRDIELDEAPDFDDLYIFWLEQDLPKTSEYRELTHKPKIPKPSIKKPSKKSKNSFGYASHQTGKLNSTLKQLQLKIDLLDETQSPIENLYEILISKDYTQISKKVYLNCQTTQFSYIIVQLKKYFNNLSAASIERSGLFYSKTNAPLKAGNLYKNRNTIPKDKDKIDAAFKEML